MKKLRVFSILMAACFVFLTGCGSGSAFTGVYAGRTSDGHKSLIKIESDGTIYYASGSGSAEKGTWEKNSDASEPSILAKFDGEVSEKSEPLVISMVGESGNTIVVDSYNDSWDADTYDRVDYDWDPTEGLDKSIFADAMENKVK